jgi:hypothetical protein
VFLKYKRSEEKLQNDISFAKSIFLTAYSNLEVGKKRSEMAPLERSWRWGRTF